MLSYCREISFHKALKQSTSLNKDKSLAELRVIQTVAELWGSRLTSHVVSSLTCENQT